MPILKQKDIMDLNIPVIIYKVPLYQLGNVTNIFIKNNSSTVSAIVDVMFVNQYEEDAINQNILSKEIKPKKTLEIEAEFENELLLQQLDRIKIKTTAPVSSNVIGNEIRKVQAIR